MHSDQPQNTFQSMEKGGNGHLYGKSYLNTIDLPTRYFDVHKIINNHQKIKNLILKIWIQINRIWYICQSIGLQSYNYLSK